jgi:serine/threonine protein kinase/tetratricopeptide (TPR) repeat protein
MDDPLLKSPQNDPSQDTLETRAETAPPQISSFEAVLNAQPGQTAHQSSFASGEIVARRFQIVRFIAQGGMGEVYEAFDIELKQKVALKTIRSAFMTDTNALERFRKEIVVAKRVTHPNVCRTFDLFRHEAAIKGQSDVLVVSMELLAGTTLDQLLKEKGKLTADEALPLVKQMVAGLAAAHEAGVVHRDFKTNNVMLVPPASGSGSMRLVVSDFGLAHSLDAGEFVLTQTGEMLGTPAFMAPEQVTGKEITPATDIYSLGVVMYEMVTGRLPFEGKNWREVAFQRLEVTPPVANSLQPDLDETWSKTIQKCMQVAPTDRFGSVTEVERALVGEIKPTIPADSARSQKFKRLLVGAAGMLLVATIGLTIGILFPDILPWTEPPSVTVLGFRNISGDASVDTWGDQFRTNLGTTLDVKPIRYMSPQNMANSWKPQKPSEMPEEPTHELLARFHKYGCRYVVYGSYMVIGPAGSRKILWNIRLVDAKTGKSQGSFTKNLTESELTDVIPGAAEDVRKKLGVSVSADEKRGTDRALPSNEKASQAYAEGMNQLQNFEYGKAKDLFLAAVQADPNNAEIRSALAQAWWELGFERKAREEAKIAADQANDLSNEKRTLIKARSSAYSGNWGQASQYYASLWTISSENYQYALLLAKSQIEAKLYSQALDTLRKLDGSRVPESIKGERDLQLAEVQEHLGNNGERLRAASSAVQTAKLLGGGLLQARAEIAQCLALLGLGNVELAPMTCADAVALNEQQGDDLGTARAKNAVANAYYDRGDYDKAQPLYQEALAIAARIGDKRDEAGALLNLANIQFRRNNLLEARQAYEKTILVSTERSGINDDFLLAQQSLADVLGALGDLKKQAELLAEVISGAEAVSDKGKLALALGSLCNNQLQTGDVPGARKNCEQSLQLMVETGDKNGQARSHQALADVLLAGADLPEAGTHYQQALRIQQELELKTDAAYTQASLLGLSIEKKDYPGVVKSGQELLKVFITERDTVGELLIRCDLAEAFLKLGRVKDAQDQILEAKAQLHDLQDPSLRATFSIQQAIVENSAKQSEAAISELKKTETEMRKAGSLQIALEAKLARAQVLAGAARKTELKAVAEEAKQHGYLLLARKAAETLGA